MEAMRETFLERIYDFDDDMSREDGAYWDAEKSYKYAARGEVVSFAVDSRISPEAKGKAIYERLCQSTIQGLPLSWRTRAEVVKSASEHQQRFYSAIAALADRAKPVGQRAEEGARALEELRVAGIAALRRGEVLNITLSVLGSLEPNECCWFKVSMFDKAALLLLGKRLFPSSHFVRAEFDEFQSLLFRVRDVLEDGWSWRPETLEDVQGFLWVALSETWDVDWGPFPDPLAVDAVMAEYDELGGDGFSAAHPGFGTPTEYWVRGNGERTREIYPSKPIAAIAMGWESINGGWSTPKSACSLLHRAGYQIVDENGRRVPVPRKPYLAASADLAAEEDKMTQLAPKPTNLILYGPPGSGKTYATATEAVRLCGEAGPEDREALMAIYRRLSDAGRIEFVTFHQSFAYEDFVEGLRPAQASDEGAAGFELRPEPGVFRRIARRAETSTGPGDVGFSIGGRQVFKMSIGEAANPDDAYMFEDAIAGGYTLLGYDDIDWSDDRFASRAAIIEAVMESGTKQGGKPNAMSGRVQMPFIFRNWVKRGDIIVVSKGNSLFRAIGEVAGDYEFAPREGGDYGHRRAVRWLWVDRTGVPVSEIYTRGFTQKAIYLLYDADLNLPALERYIASQQDAGTGAPEPFVLIIDEINRANISKVFGELITLLEPDKRLGQPNALTVRLPYSGDMFGVPANLHILGTMNTADRSIALLDTALRRRFEFRELMPDASLLKPVDGIDLTSLLTAINERIEYLFDREHQVGHAYFMGCQTRAGVDEVMRHKVIPLLAEYFYEDWAKVAAVLGDGDDGEGNREGRFIDRRQLKAPKGTDAEDSAPRYRWVLRDLFSYEGFASG
jgi:5-methylcytosine-specific restriction protein B